MAAGETAVVMGGAETQLAIGGQMRIHTQQTIGMLGVAVKPGQQDISEQVIAALGPFDVQAQAGAMMVRALNVIKVKNANAHIDWAAAKKITISTVGGVNITIDGDNISEGIGYLAVVSGGSQAKVGIPERLLFFCSGCQSHLCRRR